MRNLPSRLRRILLQWPVDGEGDVFLRKDSDCGWVWEGNGGGHIAFPKWVIHGGTLHCGVLKGMLFTAPQFEDRLMRGFKYWRTNACKKLEQDDDLRLILRHHSVVDPAYTGKHIVQLP